ncbi:MAG TPA: hypothetical protein VM368_00840, partial [Flavisolibacter sp.]|nr:hypothetical protein [Flavisolibacter sp.]
MPDLFTIVFRWWKFIVLTTVAATAIALVASLLSSKKYLSTATALPANSLLADKARLFNTNIESLYSELGTVDELDKIEGTATLDTIYIATVNELNLVDHYGIEANGEAAYKAALRLKKETNINKSAYGELKIKAWDKDQNLAAQIANSLLQNIQQLHQNVQVSHTRALIEKIKDEYSNKQK